MVELVEVGVARRNMMHVMLETCLSRLRSAEKVTPSTRTWSDDVRCGGAGSRVVKSLDCDARGPGFESRISGAAECVGIICKYLSL